MKRDPVTDVFRGLAVVLMIFVSALYLLSHDVPFPMLHNQGNDFLFFDLVAPMFQFVLGMSLFFIVQNKLPLVGRDGVTWDVLRRCFVLFLLGFVLDSVSYLDAMPWGVLQSLGLSGVIVFLISSRSNLEKILFSAFILLAYSLLYYNPLFSSLISMPHGGPIGAISYSIISILGFMSAEVMHKRRSDKGFLEFLVKTALSLLVLGAIVGLFIPYSKIHVSPSFTLAASGLVMILFSVIFLLHKYLGNYLGFLKEFGRTALTMWVLQYIFGWIFLFVLHKKQFLDFTSGLLVSVGVVILMYFIALALNKLNIRISP